MSPITPARRLAPAAGLEVVSTPDGLVLATATGVLRLDGGVAVAVLERLLPELERRPTVPELLVRLRDLPGEELTRIVERLVGAGLISELPSPGEPTPPAWLSLITSDLAARQRVAERLSAVRLLLIGQEPVTAVLSRTLAEAGISHFDILPPEGLDRDDVADLVRGRDLVLTVVDPGFAAVRAWVNQAGLAAEVPSLQVSLEGADARLGPLVLPGEGPCYLCWRMRALACADDFDLAMAREEALDRARAPLNRPLLPGLVESAAAVLVRDVLALTTSIGQPALAAHVITIDALRGSQTTDTVLTRPDCPACSKKGRPPAEDPCLSELESEPRRETDFDTIAATAAGELCGLVRNLDLIPKVLAEPRQPLIVRAEVANVRFAAGDDAFMTCSGKGMDLLGARNTALGEALERYSSLTWKPPRHRRARRDQLDYPSLDPRELVLFAESQYASLPFAPYSEESELDWVPARSLVSDREVWVPLQGATLGSEHTHGRGLLFGPTSNGFAAGPSLSFAVEHALLEVIERDAFLLAWMHRLETQPYQASTIPDDTTRSIAELYARRGVRIEVHLLPTDSLATVAMAVA
ncbi:MAG: TOMM precursor leader peptide-binding protein, partial [Micropruina sp.]